MFGNNLNGFRDFYHGINMSAGSLKAAVNHILSHGT
jgi:hypothetical protein